MKKNNTLIHSLGGISDNILYIKRDDLLPYSFGGNKARKARYFFQEINDGQYDCVVTYGSSSSNHCRVVSNMATARKLPCYIIGPEEVSEMTFNSRMMKLFGAEITIVPVEQVHETIEHKLNDLRKIGKHPYFIPGGGHGNLGTQAYIDCYEEIKQFEEESNIYFDYIFFASGTGTTQAGLVCGQLMHGDDRKIVGISIARKNPRGRNVVLDSIREYLQDSNISNAEIIKRTIFLDEYSGDGYGIETDEINEVIKEIMVKFGIPLDSTYTGKAFLGMRKYLSHYQIQNKKILFIHTGGTPLFFDDLEGF